MGSVLSGMQIELQMITTSHMHWALGGHMVEMGYGRRAISDLSKLNMSAVSWHQGLDSCWHATRSTKLVTPRVLHSYVAHLVKHCLQCGTGAVNASSHGTFAWTYCRLTIPQQ